MESAQDSELSTTATSLNSGNIIWKKGKSGRAKSRTDTTIYILIKLYKPA